VRVFTIAAAAAFDPDLLAILSKVKRDASS
jgi:hypothetical protein